MDRSQNPCTSLLSLFSSFYYTLYSLRDLRPIALSSSKILAMTSVKPSRAFSTALNYFVRHQRLASVQGLSMDWQISLVVPTSPIVKKILCLDIPIDSYPNVRRVTNSIASYYKQ